MGQREAVIALAKRQVGVTEEPPGSNNVLYNTAYYGAYQDQPWCVTFLWWVFRELGLSGLFCGGTKTAYTVFVLSWAQSHGQWVTGGYRPGDMVLMKLGSGADPVDHIGLVTAVNGAALTTVEGNCGDAVREMTRSEVGILGAYRPEYGEEPSQTPQEEAPKESGTYTVRSGDTLWGIAETFLGSGARYPEILEANGLTSIIIYPGQVLRLPGQDGRQTVTVTIRSETWELLQLMAAGWGKTPGETIDEIVKAL